MNTLPPVQFIVEPWLYTDGSIPPEAETIKKIVEQIIKAVPVSAGWPKIIDVNYPPLQALLGPDWAIGQTIKGAKNFFIFEVRYQKRSVASSRGAYKEFPPLVVIYHVR